MSELTGSTPSPAGFWGYQKESWRSLALTIRQAYRNRRGGVVATAAAVVALPAGGGFLFWPDSDDIHITSHDDSKDVVIPRCVQSLRGSGTLPKGHHLWIAVEFPNKAGDNRVVFAREATMRSGRWHADQINVGGPGHIGNTYTLTAVDVDGLTHEMLATTVIDMYGSKADTLSAGADLWRFSSHGYTTGARPRDEVNVSRGTDQRSCAEIADGQRTRS
ncbi:hypothetical protein ACIBU0_39270 [Streptomyces sp. NPDC049627]|uniref:hypothetical protein n=1 Tax=Streptomyces sp. NPDC049627 TaxID=3365595 RepID=UPI0037B91840